MAHVVSKRVNNFVLDRTKHKACSLPLLITHPVRAKLASMIPSVHPRRWVIRGSYHSRTMDIGIIIYATLNPTDAGVGPTCSLTSAPADRRYKVGFPASSFSQNSKSIAISNSPSIIYLSRSSRRSCVVVVRRRMMMRCGWSAAAVVAVVVMVGVMVASPVAGELARVEHPTKEDGSLAVLVVGDWGRKGQYNQTLVATQVYTLHCMSETRLIYLFDL